MIDYKLLATTYPKYEEIYDVAFDTRFVFPIDNRVPTPILDRTAVIIFHDNYYTWLGFMITDISKEKRNEIDTYKRYTK